MLPVAMRRTGTRAFAAAALVLLVGGSTGARAEPWVAPGDVPVPAWASSVHILDRDEPLSVRPAPKAKRRGSAAKDVRLPLYAARQGPGCSGRWLMVGPVAWVCEDRVKLSRQPPVAAARAPHLFSDGLPYRYHFVGRFGAFGYANLSLAEEGVPDAQLEPGFAVALLQVADRRPGDPFGLTSHGLWVPMRDLSPARTFLFAGESLSGGALAVAWVFTETAPLYDAPRGRRIPGAVRTQFEQLSVLETATRGDRRWFRVGKRQWVSDRHARAPRPGELPAGVGPGERWIDVDITNQVVTAYAGEQPVFATLASTGKGRGQSIQATPQGEFRLWVKLRSSDMDNLENEEAGRLYAIQDVPWVMYFKEGYGLHGTFWHRRFGHVQSHGCVNLAPLDAQRLFHWTSPKLPAGWSAVLPTHHERGTLIRVR